MSLSRHVDPEDIIRHLQDLRIPSESAGSTTGQTAHLTPFSTPYTSQRDIPKYQIPPDGAPGDTVYEMLKDELDLDGRPNLNLASFVDTYLEDNAQRLMVENMGKNLADNDEYPAMLAISNRCVSILAHLWAVQKGEKAVGSPTVGSSEAIHLGGLAMKRRWQERRREKGLDTSKPNIIMGANAQVALLKFARYFEVEARVLPVSEKSKFCLDPDLVRENVDENTIGVFVILGSTYTGHFEPVETISKILDEYQEKTGVDIPIHVDAASGGFVVPFTHAGTGGWKWNFELPRVVSINASGNSSPPPSTRTLTNKPRPQIRPRNRRRRLDHLARPILPLQRPHLRAALPRRHRRVLHAQLLPARRAGHRAVLQPHPPRLLGLPRGHGELPGQRAHPLAEPRSHRLVHLC
jgi:glutamate decarboxylase